MSEHRAASGPLSRVEHSIKTPLAKTRSLEMLRPHRDITLNYDWPASEMPFSKIAGAKDLYSEGIGHDDD